MAKTLTGTVVKQTGRYFEVACPEAPSHLKVIHLSSWQMGKAKIGDRVTLTYQTSPSSGLWNITEVLR